MKSDGAVSTSDKSPAVFTSAARVFKALFVMASVAILFSGLYKTLWVIWRNNPNYSHGILIPVISLILVLGRRKSLLTLPVTPSAWGLPIIAGGVLMHLMGIRGEITLIQGVCFSRRLGGSGAPFRRMALAAALGFPDGFPHLHAARSAFSHEPD
ncbi:MAG: exosortase/archaeosortase family protein [Candidatus Eisenbacteria bacterium]|nr:exosortase/archaeosortase family protein [Candidatus Eisenbacteria bacterium]